MLNNLGDGSTLSLDFTTGVLDPRLTFSRAGGGTYVGPDGYIYGIDNATSSSLAIGTGSKSVTLTATAGVNRRFEVGQTVYFSNGANNMSGLVTAYSPSTQVITINATSSSGSGSFTSWFVGNASARFDYDPTPLTPRGLSIEGASTNRMYGSESLASSGLPINWSFSEQVTRNSTLVTSPRGTDDAVTVNETTANNIHRTSQYTNSGFTAGSICTLSCWAKVAKSSTPRKLYLNLGNTLNSSGLFDLTATGDSGTAQATSGTATNKATSWTKYPNGWYRLTVTGNWVSEATQFFQINRASSTTCTDDSFSGETDNGIIIWGAQLEAGSGASSYIPTGASQVSRAVDFCTMPTASFIPSNPYPQTLFVDCIPNTPSSAFLNIARIFDRTGGGAFSYGTEIYYYNASTMTVGRKITASTNTDRSFASGLSYGTRHKFALSIDASSYSGSYDGVTALGVATAPAALATVATHLGVGCTGDTTPASVMFGTIRQIKFFPFAMAQSQLNAVTTL